MSSTFLASEERFPVDRTTNTNHPAPYYRESESHPLRLIAYAFHPIGWFLRETIFRPFSYFASQPNVRDVMGYKGPKEYEDPSCFDSDLPDCKSVAPYNYASMNAEKLPEFEQKIFFPDVNFDTNIRKLNSTGYKRVAQIAQLLKSSPNLVVVLEGHADDRGDDKFNSKLGVDRAESVRNELINLGVSANQLATVSFGESKPSIENSDNWSRAVNRRVEVKLEADY